MSDDEPQGRDPYAPPEAEVADVGAAPTVERSWFDRQFADTNTALLVVAALCCACPAFILAVFGVIFTRDPEAKRKARLLLYVSLAMMAISFVLRLVLMIANGEFDP